MTLTRQKFIRGMTPQQYINQMKTNQEAFRQVLASMETPPEDKAYFSSLPEALRVAVFTEDWCGDSLISTPALFHLAEDAGKLEVRVFLRDQNWDLANSYLPEHRCGTVPVFVFFTRNMREVGRFIETAQELVPFIDEMEKDIIKAHPELPDISKRMDEMSESTRNLVRQERRAARVKHAKEWGQIVMHGFRQVVTDGLSRKPGEGPAEGGTKFPPP